MTSRFLFVLAGVLSCAGSIPTARVAQAGPPPMMSYQGYLTDATGTPRTGTFPMTFQIYADSIGGAPVWTESYAGVDVMAGVFSVMLGRVTELSPTLLADGPFWLQSTIADTVLVPRRPLGSLPHAMRASLADSATRVPPSTGPWATSGGDVYRISGNVGIGTATPQQRLDVSGTVQLQGFRLPSGAAPGFVLTSDAAGFGQWQPTSVAGIGGGGTPGSIARFTAPTTISSSVMWESGGLVGVGLSGPTAKLHVASDASGTRGLVVQGAGGQSANLQEWRNYTGNALAWMDPDGLLHGNGQMLYPLNAGALTVGLVPSSAIGGTYSNPVSFMSSSNIFVGNGAGLVALNASALSSGTLPPGALGGVYPNFINLTNASNTISGSFSGYHSGNGSGLGNLNASALVGTVPGNALYGTYSNPLTLGNPSNTFYGAFFGSGAGLSNLNANGISSGNLDSGRLPAGGNWGLSSNLNIDAGTLTVDAGNNRVGIGTTTPNKALTIAASLADFEIETAGPSNFDITTPAGSGGAISLSAREASSSGITISTSNNIGIATPTPGNILTVQQNSATDPIADGWTTYSSRRWKENIVPITDALATVQRLRGVTFDWKETGRHDLGMIAEEVGAVVPEVVAFEENGTDARSIDYARLTALLVEATKELKAENDALRARLETLERRLVGLGGTADDAEGRTGSLVR